MWRHHFPFPTGSGFSASCGFPCHILSLSAVAKSASMPSLCAGADDSCSGVAVKPSNCASFSDIPGEGVLGFSSESPGKAIGTATRGKPAFSSALLCDSPPEVSMGLGLPSAMATPLAAVLIMLKPPGEVAAAPFAAAAITFDAAAATAPPSSRPRTASSNFNFVAEGRGSSSEPASSKPITGSGPITGGVSTGPNPGERTGDPVAEFAAEFPSDSTSAASTSAQGGPVGPSGKAEAASCGTTSNAPTGTGRGPGSAVKTGEACCCG
mmetsp:Transcript_118110/g.252402  ORF Transcript_118110/g.252402 Transcript_118110/m.252402 type:complete len:267 (-) Transcript_118110:1387-2187(-)